MSYLNSFNPLQEMMNIFEGFFSFSGGIEILSLRTDVSEILRGIKLQVSEGSFGNEVIETNDNDNRG
jgi:hypothetical protein